VRIKGLPCFQVAVFRSLLVTSLCFICLFRVCTSLSSPLYVNSPCFRHDVCPLIAILCFATILGLTAAGCTMTRFCRVLTINVQDEWTEMCKRNVRDVMIVRHESETKNENEKKKDRGEERHGKLEPERKISHTRKRKAHALKGRGPESNRAAAVATVAWQPASKCKRRVRRVFTASTVDLAAPRQGHKSKSPPTQLEGTPGGPEGPPEPAEPVLVHQSVSAPRGPARIGLR